MGDNFEKTLMELYEVFFYFSICLLAFVGHIIAGRILEKNGDIGINVKYRRNIV
jgi:hypothetical protein